MTQSPVDKPARRGTQLIWLYRVLGVLGVALLALTGTLSILQTQRVDNLRSAYAVQRTDAEQAATTAGNEYGALSTQYQNLFEACRKSPSCLAAAPAEQAPIIIQGTPGAPGRSVTPAEIAAALQAYCDTHNACIGTAGAPGAAGAVGAAGQNGTNGTPGAVGAAGAPGADGRGIQSIACITTGTSATAFEFTFTDGTKVDVAGQCTPPPPVAAG